MSLQGDQLEILLSVYLCMYFPLSFLDKEEVQACDLSPFL